jgi:hypothetical protein
MRYLATTLGTSRSPPSSSLRAVTAILGAVLPRANPDLDDLIPRVARWYVEVDDVAYLNARLGWMLRVALSWLRQLARTSGSGPIMVRRFLKRTPSRCQRVYSKRCGVNFRRAHSDSD